ncbi:hypothetical protein RclHR1_19360001 [Rhizophagus clarus]|uniref:Kinase-like domain-containing protein n=1 Tax=Rhizophagus clarus TaxID=94130 RepID=A0A2Z6RHC7_9GLOM|nr:hypothetical protein RclHR1_19360001 [Rhizophagus clarus]GES76936.1 kinase-like domain-containing protein [Rhizophagus clarus]
MFVSLYLIIFGTVPILLSIVDTTRYIFLITSCVVISTGLISTILKVYEVAENNKKICFALVERVGVITGSLNSLELRKNLVRKEAYYDAFYRLNNVLNQIREFIEQISQIRGFKKYAIAISINERLMRLTIEYEAAMKDLQFTLVVANEEQRKIDEEVLMEDNIQSGKHLTRIDNKVEDLTGEIKNIKNFLEENFRGKRGANADILTEVENFRVLLDEEWIKKKIEEKDINYFEYSEFSNIEIIGEGGFGIVKKAITGGKNRVALKCLTKKSSNINIKVFESLMMELKTLREVSYHKNIISFLGISNDNGYVVVLEYANEGNLRDYLTKKFESLEWEKKIQMALDITCGLKFLHSKGIIHRDLHSKNVLVNNGELLIADFGFSERLTEVTFNSTGNRMGVIEYVEPQCFKDKDYVKDKRSDVYSLGVLLWEITSGYPPFLNIENRDMLGYQISHNNLREDPIEGTPLEYQLLYQECWDDNPVKRPNIDQVYKEISRLSNVNCTNEQEDSLAVSVSNVNCANKQENSLAAASASNSGGPNSLNNQSDLSDLYLSDTWIGPRNESAIVDINQF